MYCNLQYITSVSFLNVDMVSESKTRGVEEFGQSLIMGGEFKSVISKICSVYFYTKDS